MKITLLSKPGFSGNMLVRKIEEVAKSHLKEIKKVVKVPVGVISLKDYGLLDGSSIIKYAKQLIQK